MTSSPYIDIVVEPGDEQQKGSNPEQQGVVLVSKRSASSSSEITIQTFRKELSDRTKFQTVQDTTYQPKTSKSAFNVIKMKRGSRVPPLNLVYRHSAVCMVPPQRSSTAERSDDGSALYLTEKGVQQSLHLPKRRTMMGEKESNATIPMPRQQPLPVLRKNLAWQTHLDDGNEKKTLFSRTDQRKQRSK